MAKSGGPSGPELARSLDSLSTDGLLRRNGRALDASSSEVRQVVEEVSHVNTQLIDRLGSDPKLIWQLPPRKFEEVVARLLEKQGYSVELTPASCDGGFDIYAARKEPLGRFLYFVECKRYLPPHRVGIDIVRALHGVVVAGRATAGAVVTSSFFTKGARNFEKELSFQMHLHDFERLKEWLRD